MSSAGGRRVEPLLPGDPNEVGPYLIEGRIGRGGQASVYLGRTPTGDAVAVKVFAESWLADPEAKDQVRAEIAALRGIAAFGTARLLDAAPDAHPAYLVSEYVLGPNLEQAVRTRGPLRGPDLDRFALATLTGLRSIHAGDLVHRDLKPSNVLLGPDGPRIVDFGIVARRGAVEDASDGVLGTREYLAPELLDGGPVGPSADIFGWAATMVFAATGRPPTGPGDTLPEVPAAVAALLRRCLDADPDRRPDAAQAMELVLEAAHLSREEPPLPVAPSEVPEPSAPSAAPSSTPSSTPSSAVPTWGTAPAAPPAIAHPAPSTTPVTVASGERRAVSWLPAGAAALIAGVIVVVTLSSGVNVSRGVPDDHRVQVGVEQPADAGAVRAVPAAYPPAPVVRPRTDELAGVLVVPGASTLTGLPMSVAPDGLTVTVLGDCELGTWSTTTGQELLHRSVPASGGVCLSAVGPDGRFEISASAATSALRSTDLTVTDRTGGLPVRSTTLPDHVVRAEFSADGRRVALGLLSGEIVVHDLVEDRRVGGIAAGNVPSDVRDWAVDATLEQVAAPAAGGRDRVRIWTVSSGRPRAEALGLEPWSRRQLTISPDGTRLAVARPDGTVGVWSLASNRPLATLAAGDTDPFAVLAYSPDGRYLAAVSASGGRLWDSVTGVPVGPRLVLVGDWGDSVPEELRFSADGSRLVVRGSTGAVVGWELTDRRPADPAPKPSAG